MDHPGLTDWSSQPKTKITLLDVGNRWLIQAPPGAKRELGTSNGTLSIKSSGTWECPRTPVSAYELFRSFDVQNPSPAFLDMARHGRQISMRIAATEDDGDTLGYLGAATQPWEWQRRARVWLQKMLALPGSGAFLYMGMGTGKTRTCLDTARVKSWQRILVCAPKAALPVWEKQANLHYPDIFRVVVLDSGSVAQRADRMMKALMFSNPTIIVINYDAIWRDEFANRVRLANFDACIADECHRLKGRSTAVGKFFHKMWRFVPHRIAMTGTPLSNGALTDFYGQARYIDSGVFGTRLGVFEENYVWHHPENKYVVQWRNVDHFFQRFWMITHHEDRGVLDLPDIMFEERTYEMKGVALAAYSGMRDEFVAELEAGTVTAANAAVKVSKLQQITSGRVLKKDETNPKKNISLLVHQEKALLLEEILRETGDEPVVVFCQFVEDLAQVRETCAKLKAEYREVSGRQNNLKDWQAGDGTVLGVQIRAGSESIDLVRSRIVVFFSLTFSLKDHEQAIARVHRPGQTRNCLVVFLIAEGSIDRQIQKAVEKKQDLVSMLIASKEVL
jgi:superfamily II DNA or RNA helicase